jgi:dihydroflavonol-4-reductase
MAEGDFTDQGSLLRALEGCDYLFHAGPYFPLRTLPVDEAIARGLADVKTVMAAAEEMRIKRVVYTSTLFQIGPPRGVGRLADETDPFETVFRQNPYLMAKHAMEEEVKKRADGGLPVVIVNPTAFFGPYDSRPTSGTQILMIARRQMPAYVEGPVNVIDVRDVAMGEVLALEKGRVGERYILGHWNTTQGELNRLIARLAHVPPPRFKVPWGLARFGAKTGEKVMALLHRDPPVPSFFVEALCHFQHYNCTKAIQELGLPQNPVEGAIRDALAWFREHRYLSS